MRVNKAGFVDTFDTIVSAYNRDACEEQCLNALSFTTQSQLVTPTICRAYTFDSSKKKCYLSHLSQKQFGRNILDSMNENLSSGDLENCIQCMNNIFYFCIIC